MSDRGKGRRHGPRGTKGEIEAVRSSAELAGRELGREQDESANHLAQALSEINEDEAVGHVQARLGFLERQVERLTARRDDADRGVQAELAVMRARIEETLQAVAATAEDHREARAVLEKRFTTVGAEADRRAAGLVETLRQELVARVHETANRLERHEARLQGEIKAFEGESEERARSVATSVAQIRQVVGKEVGGLEQRVGRRTEAVERLVEEARLFVEQRVRQAEAALVRRMDGVADAEPALRAEIAAALEAARGEMLGRLEEAAKGLRQQVDERASELDARSAAQAGVAADLHQDLRAVLERVTALEDRNGELAKLEPALRAEIAAAIGARHAELVDRMEAGLAEAGGRSADLAGRLAELEAGLGELHRQSEEAEASRARSDERFAALAAGLEELASGVSALAAGSAEKADSLREALDRLARESEHRAAALEGRLEEGIVSGGDALAGRFGELETEVRSRLERELRELEGRLSETRAEVRIEAQRLWEATETRHDGAGERMETMRRALLDRIRSSEEKAAGAAVHLESLLREHHRQIVSDEQEWSEALSEVVEELSSLRVRVEELLGRLSSAEARFATERGTSGAALDGVAGRIDVLEESVRAAIGDVVARQATRLELLAARVAAIAESETAAEERLGAVEYLKRRLAEVADRVDRLLETGAPERESVPRQAAVDELAARLAALEERLAKAGDDRAGSPPVPDRQMDELAALEGRLAKAGEDRLEAGLGMAVEPILARLEAVEHRLASVEGTSSAEPAAEGAPALAELAARLEAAEDRLASAGAAGAPPVSEHRLEQLAARLEDLERRVPVAPVILAERKRRRH